MSSEDAKDKAENTPTWVGILVSLIVGILTGSGGLALGLWDRISPENQAPTANIVLHPKEGYAPLNVAMIASGSLDPEGEPMTYKWTVGDSQLDVSSMIHDQTFNEPGTVVINVEVTDKGGLVASAADTVTVRDRFNLRSFLEN